MPRPKLEALTDEQVSHAIYTLELIVKAVFSRLYKLEKKVYGEE